MRRMKSNMKTKKNTIKRVKAWAVEFENNKVFMCDDIYDTQKEAMRYAHDCADEMRYRIIPVLITPIKKVVKNKVRK